VKTHEAADLFPLLEGAELQALVDSMKRHGFDSTKPIVRCNGWIIDGRNRLRAAEIAGVEPVFVDISESTDPWMEAWKHNGARRDLDPDRKGAIFLEVIDSSEAWKKEQERRRNAANKARSEAAKGNQNARKSLPPAGDFSPERKAAIALDRTERGRQGKESRAPRGASPNQGKSAAALATQAGVSTRTIERAQKLKREAPERHLAVVRGETRAHAELRQLKHQGRTKKLAEIAKGNTELATGRRYPVIYADPPWRYEHVKTESRAIENQYPTMDLDSICALPETVYRAAFPDFSTMVSHRRDGYWQRLGVDRSVILNTSRQIKVDEKVRGRNKKTNRVYDDILLEHVSNDRTGAPGWVVKPLLADYIAYAIAPLGRCYLLPVVQLQLAWRDHGHHWRSKWGDRKARNCGYWTISTPVPVKPLFAAIGDCLRCSFEPLNLTDEELEAA